MAVFRRDTDNVIDEKPELFSGQVDLFDSPSDDESEGGAPKKSSQKNTGPVAPWRIKLLRFGGIAGIGVLLLPLAAGGALLGAFAALLERSPRMEEFEGYNPPEMTTILDSDGNALASLFDQKRFVVNIAQLPPELPRAFVAIEDERFYEHWGVDPIGIARAMFINVTRGKMSQGASTITQQTARNLLPHIGNVKSYSRKIQEMLVAFQMEHLYSKDQILEVYLNQIYLGSGTYGVQAAALAYFGKSAADLEPWQCATLAGLPQLPERYSPLNNPDLAKRRRDQVLWKMLKVGVLSDKQYNNAITTDMLVAPNRLGTSRAPYFVDAVRRQLAEHPQLGGDQLQTAGWRIRTTINPAVQRIAEETLREELNLQEALWVEGRQERFTRLQESAEFERSPAPGQVRMAEVSAIFDKSLVVVLPGGWRADLTIPPATAHFFRRGETIELGQGVDIEVVEVMSDRGLFRGRLLPQQRMQGAIVCMDARTGDVRALVGGRQYNDPENNGFFNRALMARRPAGSTMKPLFVAHALELGYTPNTIVRDSELVFGDGYAPKNYDRRFRGGVTMQYSIEQSLNIPIFRAVQHVGLRPSLKQVAQFQRTGDRPWRLPREWPVVLGMTAITPLELAAAYQPIANGGLARGPRLVEAIWNEQNRAAIIPAEKKPEKLIGNREAAWLVQMMAGVMLHGTGERARAFLPESLKNKAAGKSGTTDENRDSWFAGFTPHEVVVVWIGFDQNIPLSKEQTGGKSAGIIWGKYLAKIWELKSEEEQAAPFFLPEGYSMVAVQASNGRPVFPGTNEWVDPPTLRIWDGPAPKPPVVPATIVEEEIFAEVIPEPAPAMDVYQGEEVELLPEDEPVYNPLVPDVATETEFEDEDYNDGRKQSVMAN